MSRTALPFFLFSFFFLTSAQAQHTIMIKDGSKKVGEVKSISGPTLTLSANGRPVEILVSDVLSIHFFETEAKTTQAAISSRREFKNGFDKIEYLMEGRTMTKFPKIGLGTKDNGVVVVDVTIDKYGNVISAEPGAPGSKTTDDKYLFVKAQAACQQAKFDNDPTAPLSTQGKVFVIFP